MASLLGVLVRSFLLWVSSLCWSLYLLLIGRRAPKRIKEAAESIRRCAKAKRQRDAESAQRTRDSWNESSSRSLGCSLRTDWPTPLPSVTVDGRTYTDTSYGYPEGRP